MCHTRQYFVIIKTQHCDIITSFILQSQLKMSDWILFMSLLIFRTRTNLLLRTQFVTISDLILITLLQNEFFVLFIIAGRI